MTLVAQTPDAPRQVGDDGRSPRVIGAFGIVATWFTAMCCIGVSAAVSLSTSVGATFLTRDSTLRPLLAASLSVTVVGSALTFWRRRRPVPLIASALAAVWVYAAAYLVGGGHSGHAADHMNDHAGGHAAAHHAGFSAGRLGAIWLGLAVLVGSQAWDLLDARRGHNGPARH
ncbi:MAG: MerC family mercury resistance protein [Acidimicrobiales bacterium]